MNSKILTQRKTGTHQTFMELVSVRGVPKSRITEMIKPRIKDTDLKRVLGEPKSKKTQGQL